MTKTFTQDDILRFLYKELPKEDHQAFEQELLLDTDLQEEVRDCYEMMQLIDHAMVNPKDDLIEQILNNSKSLNLHASN
jgi:hypothetical protein